LTGFFPLFDTFRSAKQAYPVFRERLSRILRISVAIVVVSVAPLR